MSVSEQLRTHPLPPPNPSLILTCYQLTVDRLKGGGGGGRYAVAQILIIAAFKKGFLKRG